MICPKCEHSETKVIDSRDTMEGKSIRRRRECLKCQYRFTTFENVETANFLVVKKDGVREQYNREKLEMGIRKSCEKRPVSQQQIKDMLDSLEEQWAAIGKEVPSETIGEGVMEELKKIDEVSYIRFASVYRQFKDVESFKKELVELLK